MPRLLSRGAVGEAAERADSIREAAAHIQKHVRAILRQLRPSHALAFGLPAAVSDLVAFWERRSPDTTFRLELELDGAPLDRQIEDVAYRLVQESISNAVRHGQPRRVIVSLRRRADRHLSLTIEDDGVGLSASAAGVGMGLAGMAERVGALQGRFEIGAGAGGRGVRARALLPLRGADRAALMVAQ